jgi:hypothetical protein
MADKEVPVYIRKEYVCGSCQYSMSVNWDNKTVVCLNESCEMVLVNLQLKPVILKVRSNVKTQNNSKTINR